MKVSEMIVLLQKLDPELPVIGIYGDCDDVHLHTGPIEGFVNDEKDPYYWTENPGDELAKVKAVWL